MNPQSSTKSITNSENRLLQLASSVSGVLLWAGVGLSLTLFTLDDSNRLSFMSGLSIAFGAWVFFAHGGRAVTAAGIYSICSALFVGFPGIYYNTLGTSPGYLADAVSLAYLSNVAMYYIFWRSTGPTPPVGRVDVVKLRGVGTIGLIMLIAGALAGRMGIGPDALAAPTAFVGVLLVVAPLVLGGRRTMRPFAIVISAVAALFYVQFVFSGYGRLVLSALLFSLAAIFTLRCQSRLVKILILICIPPALIFLIEQREDFGIATYGQALDGVGSIVAPFEQFAVLLRDYEMLGLNYGDTFWAAAVTLIPSAVWQNKPEGFGLVLARIYEPELADRGVTYAALSHGEWVLAFGSFGLLLMTLILGFLIRKVDQCWNLLVGNGISTRKSVIAIVAIAVIIGAITDILWGGSHTFMGRAGVRLLVLALFALLWTGWPLTRSTKRPKHLSTLWG